MRRLTDYDGGPKRPLVLAASTGGHLAQLVRLAPGLGASDDSLWVTFDSPQSRSLLRDRNVLHVPYIRPRDGRSAWQAFRTLQHAPLAQYAGAVSTGSALAVAALPAARLQGIPTLYIESVSRVFGPSLSGRMLQAMGFSELRSQHPAWAGGRWGVHSSVLGTFASVERPGPAVRPRLFVTLGTIGGYGFESVVNRILDLGLADDDTVWQLGDTRPKRALPGEVFQQVSGTDFERYAREADVVVTHAGVGSVLSLLDMGIYPLAVVRRKARGEHVDDHQEQIARLINSLNIGAATEVEDLDAELVALAAARAINPAVPA